jgi:hypothetical protein
VIGATRTFKFAGVGESFGGSVATGTEIETLSSCASLALTWYTTASRTTASGFDVMDSIRVSRSKKKKSRPWREAKGQECMSTYAH